MNTATPTDTAPATDTTSGSADLSFDQLMAAAEAADAGEALPDFVNPSPAPETAPSPSADPDEGAQPDETSKPAPETKAKPTTEKKPTDKPADQKPESPFTKAQKEKERQDRTWKKLDEEKAAHRAEVAKFEQERQQVSALRAELDALKRQITAAPKAPSKDEHGLDAADYDAAAKRYAAEGDEQTAALARRRAEALRTKDRDAAATAPTAPSAPAGEPWQSPEFQQKWSAEAAAIVKAEPELGDPQNPVFQAVAQLVNQSPYARFFRAHPDGIRAAVEVAKLQTSAARLPALQKELDTARQEIARLNKLTQPVGGPPAGPAPGKKPLAEMTMDEADAYLRAQAEAADRGEIT